MTVRPLPWRDWFVLARRSFGLAPEAFWGLTLAEWRWLMGADPRLAAPLSRRDLDHLLKEYPDKEL